MGCSVRFVGNPSDTKERRIEGLAGQDASGAAKTEEKPATLNWRGAAKVGRPYSNAIASSVELNPKRQKGSYQMPIRVCCRHTTWLGMRRPSGDRIRVKRCGIPAELITLSIAPEFDMLLTMQLIEPPPN
jgi:hypothetical protein